MMNQVCFYFSYQWFVDKIQRITKKDVMDAAERLGFNLEYFTNEQKFESNASEIAGNNFWLRYFNSVAKYRHLS